MGLVFALQPDLRKSTSQKLILCSSKKKFGLGGSFVFGGLLLGTMFVAAAPLFRLFWEQGGFLDRLITLAVLTPITLYPVLALGCWFYTEIVRFEQTTEGHWDVTAYEQLFGFRWKHREMKNVSTEELVAENWVGSVNTATLEARQRGKVDRYATKGHWILKARKGDLEILLERRAKKDEIELLRAQIFAFFGAPEPQEVAP